MAHLVANVTDLVMGDGVVHVEGQARTSDMEPDQWIFWEVDLAMDALAATNNQAIIAAAEAAVELESHDVGALDKRTLFGGATGI